MIKPLLYFPLLFQCLLCGAQNSFKEQHSPIWVKGISTTELEGSFNYNSRIPFTGVFPVLNKRYALSPRTYVFYVLKSNKGDESLFSLYDGGNLHSFYTDVIQSNQVVKVDLSYLRQGALIHFNFPNLAYKNRDSKGIFYLDNTYDKSTTALYEVMICNSCWDGFLRKKVETYLALKYGITLADPSQYWSSQGKNLWDAKLNPLYNNHIIGLVKDAYFNLTQLATLSNEEADVILKKSDDQTNFLDQSYVLIGDNGKEKAFDQQSNRFKRQWLVQNKGQHPMVVDFAVFVTPEKDMEYKLYNSFGAEFDRDRSDSLKLTFKNIAIEEQVNVYWTIGRIKPFEIEIRRDSSSINHSYQLLAKGHSQPPFAIQVVDLHKANTYFYVSEDLSFALENLPSSTYSFKVTDGQGREAIIASKDLDFDAVDFIQMPSTWTLEGGEWLVIHPEFKHPGGSYGYRWFLGKKLISTAPVLRVNYPGVFTMELKDQKGKTQRFDFTVVKQSSALSASQQQWLVSPNPVNAGEEFTVHYYFEEKQDVDFYIYTLEGKFIKREKHGLINRGEYTYRLAGKTTYLLISIINNKASIQKLIVK